MVATPIGNLEDVTFRAIRVLREVALIAAEDTRRTAKLLGHYSIETPTLSLHEHNEKRQTPRLIKRLLGGRSIAIVSDAGTPLVSDPGAKLVQEALKQGIPVHPVPGPSAILSALTVSGLADGQFVFAGFPPYRSKDRKLWFGRFTSEDRPVIIFESPHRIHRSLKEMMEVLGDRDVAICREMTKIHEELVIGPISGVLGRLSSSKGEFTVVIGPAKRLPATVSDEDIAQEFGRSTKNMRSRRAAILQVAHRFGLSSKEVYRIVEEHKDVLG